MIDVAARLEPYQELFERAMATAARFADEREKRSATAPERAPLPLRRRDSSAA